MASKGKESNNPKVTEGKGAVPAALPFIGMKDAFTRARELILQGYPRSEVSLTLEKEFNITPTTANNYIHRTRQEIVDTISTDIDSIIDVHIEIYENIYKYFTEVNNTQGALKALFQKEKLLGQHREDTSIEVNNYTNTEIVREEMFDFKKLDSSETKRLEDFLKKIG